MAMMDIVPWNVALGQLDWLLDQKQYLKASEAEYIQGNRLKTVFGKSIIR